MYCPNCSQAAAAENIRFCSKCGFDLKTVRKIVEGGAETDEKGFKTARRGTRQGAKMILLSLVLYPALVFLSALFPPDDKLVESSPSSTWFEQIGWAILCTIFLAGVARILYAVIFEKDSAEAETKIEAKIETAQARINARPAKDALPPGEAVPASEFGRWKTTGELFEPVFSRPKTSGDLQ